MTTRRPALPFTRLPRGRYRSELRIVYEGLADQYADARLHQDPRDIVGAMLATVRAATRMRMTDAHRLILVMRRLNTPPSHGFYCPVCYESRMDKIRVASLSEAHATVLIATKTSVTVQPIGCNHHRIEVTCSTCHASWEPSHVVSAAAPQIMIAQPPTKPNSELN